MMNGMRKRNVDGDGMDELTDELLPIDALASDATLGPILARVGLPVDDLVVLGYSAVDDAAAADADVWRIALAGRSVPPTVIVKRSGAGVDPFRRGWAAEGWIYTADVVQTARCWPRCFYLQIVDDGRRGLLVLEDGAPRRAGDHEDGCDPGDLQRAAATIGRLHAFARGRPEILDQVRFEEPSPTVSIGDFFTPAWSRFRERWAPDLDENLGPTLLAPRSPRPSRASTTLVHGDFRADNLLFGRDDVLVLDWADLHVGDGVYDISWLLVTSADAPDVDTLLSIYASAADLRFEEARQSFLATLPAAVVQAILMSDDLANGDRKQQIVARAVAARVKALLPLLA
jgi:hypothetical protein